MSWIVLGVPAAVGTTQSVGCPHGMSTLTQADTAMHARSSERLRCKKPRMIAGLTGS